MRHWTRRHLLKRIPGLLAGVGLAVWLPGCSGSSGTSVAERAATYDPDLECSDLRGLWPAEVKTRTDNAYTDRSTETERFCFNCTNFQRPATRGACGTCRTVKGPIQPLGWCESWTEKRG